MVCGANTLKVTTNARMPHKNYAAADSIEQSGKSRNQPTQTGQASD